jgi:hypothetical protein
LFHCYRDFLGLSGILRRTASSFFPARLRNVAASVRDAANFAGSLIFEHSITFDGPGRGNPRTDRASGATASLARAADRKSVAEQKLASYWIDVHVGEGTNTKDEAAYLAVVFARMGKLLGPCTTRPICASTKSGPMPTALAA